MLFPIKSKYINTIFVCMTILILNYLLMPNATAYAENNTDYKLEISNSGVIKIHNMRPSVSRKHMLTIENKGTQSTEYNAKANYSSGSKKLYNELDFRVTVKNNVLFEGKLKDFHSFAKRTLKGSTQENLTCTIGLPAESGNEFQGLSVSLVINVTAEGKKSTDPPIVQPDPGTLPKTGEEDPLLLIISGFFITAAGVMLLLIKKSVISNPFRRR